MSDDHQARVTMGDAWIVYAAGERAWIVYQRKYGERKTRRYAIVETEFDAVRKLIHSQQQEGQG